MDDELEDKIFYQTYVSHMKILSKFAVGFSSINSPLAYLWKLCRIYVLRPEVIFCGIILFVLLIYLQAVDVWSRSILGRIQATLGRQKSASSRVLEMAGGEGDHQSWEEVRQQSAAFAVLGRRPHMEDRFIIEENINNNTAISFFAVFDGHGGEFAADFARDVLVKNIYNKIIEVHKLLKSDGKDDFAGYDKSPYLARKQSRKDATSNKENEPVARKDSLRKAHSTTVECKPAKTTEASIADFYTAQLNSAMRAANGGNAAKETFLNNNNNAQSAGNAPPPSYEAKCYIEHGRINFGKLITDEILAADHKLVEQAKQATNIAGTTALMAIVQGSKLIVANVGDSRGVMFDARGIALNLTRHAYERVSSLSALKDEAKELASNTDRNCKRVETLSNKIKDETDAIANNDKTIAEYRNELSMLSSQIPDLNNQVCGKPGDPCDALCGGAGCGKCGGSFSCEHGAHAHSGEALKVAKDTEEAITSKKDAADQTIRALTQAKLNASEAYQKAKLGFEQSEQYLNQTNDAIKLATKLIRDVEDFRQNTTALPSESKQLAQDTLLLDLTLDPKEIDSLGNKINDAVSSLKNVESIIYKTRPDLERVNTLKSLANETKETADKILETANSVVENLASASVSQGKAQDAIQQANSNIELADKDLEQIDLETKEAESPAQVTAQQVADLATKMKRLEKNILKNELDAKEITKEATRVKLDAGRAREEAGNLQSSTSATNQTLTDRASRSENARERAKLLLQRASKLTVDTNEKLSELNVMQETYLQKNQKLIELQNAVQDLNANLDTYLHNIQENADRYRQCTI